MTNKKNTKRALILSVFALVLCVSMLVGSTYAWFTDTATTGVSTIQAGTLKVDLVDTNDATLVGQALAFQKAAGAENEPILWEPGCKYELAPVYVKNNGSLALKYQIIVNGLDGDAELLNVIDFKVMMNNGEVDLDTFEGKLAADEKSAAITLVGEMSKDAGNEYQGKTLSGLSITVVATQDTVESDSYDNQYDAGATYPTPVSNAAELAAVLANGGTASLINDITVEETINVTADATIDLNGYAIDASNNTTRPFYVNGTDVDLVINGGDKVVELGKYGLIDVKSGSGTITLNGGVYEGETDFGSFIKVRSSEGVTITLNDVTVTDTSDNGSFIYDGVGSDNVALVVNGGTFNSYNGFCSFEDGSSFKDMTLTVRQVGFENSNCDGLVIENCTITSTAQCTATEDAKGPSAAVAVSSNRTTNIVNCTLNGTKHATAVYTSGGTINMTDCTIASGDFAHYMHTSYYTGAMYKTTVDGVNATVVTFGS